MGAGAVVNVLRDFFAHKVVGGQLNSSVEALLFTALREVPRDEMHLPIITRIAQ